VLKTVANFEVKYLQYMNEDGQIVADDLPEFAKNSTILKKLYKDMNLLRIFDAKAYAMQRTGRMGTYPASVGQEAIGIGYGSVMKEEDVLVPYYRSTGGLLQHGVTMSEILAYWGGDERGSDFQNAKQDLPIAVPIATQYLNAAGVATAFKLRKQPRAAVTEIGEGGTSKGDFYEAINVAGIWKLPVLFIVNNNQWAISVPSKIQTNTETYAQKAIAAGINFLQVDGNDVIAVRDASDKALKDARDGKGATLIECISYRLCDHTTADDAGRYRENQEVDDAWSKEPILRLKKYLQVQHNWTEDDEERMKQEITVEVDKAVKIFEQTPPPAPESMIDYLFEELPEIYQAQREQIKAGGNI